MEETKKIEELRNQARIEGQVIILQRKCQLMVDLFETDDDQTIELTSDGAWGLSFLFREIAELFGEMRDQFEVKSCRPAV